MNKFILFFLILLLCQVNLYANYKHNTHTNFEIVATVNDIPITKYDLNNIKIILQSKKDNTIDLTYDNVLEYQIELIKKKIIAERSDITLNNNEKKELWNIFSKNFTSENFTTIENFCNNKNINIEILNSLLENNYIWLKYVEQVLKPKIKINDNYVDSVMELQNINRVKIKYNLSEIVLFYKNLNEKNNTKQKINDIYSNLTIKNFSKVAFSLSKSSSAKNNGLIGWIYEDELDESIVENIKNLDKNSFSKPFCIGESSGLCMIFMINDKDIIKNQQTNMVNNVRNYIFNQMLEINIRNILDDNDIKIVYR